MKAVKDNGIGLGRGEKRMNGIGVIGGENSRENDDIFN